MVLICEQLLCVVDCPANSSENVNSTLNIFKIVMNYPSHRFKYQSVALLIIFRNTIQSHVEIALQLETHHFYRQATAETKDGRNQVSRLILRPNRAYNATLRDCISSLSSANWSSSLETSASICSVDVESMDCASGRGSWKNESPILYLSYISIGLVQEFLVISARELCQSGWDGIVGRMGQDLRHKLIFICKLEFCRDFFEIFLVFLFSCYEYGYWMSDFAGE